MVITTMGEDEKRGNGKIRYYINGFLRSPVSIIP